MAIDMRKVGKVMKAVLGIAIGIVCILVIFVVSQRVFRKEVAKIKTPNGIQESTYIDVNGIKQYIQIRGEDVNNPVIIFVHGGPANPIAYTSYYYQQDIENVATFIQYDQRGCGRTYYKNGCNSDTNVDLLLEDLDGIVDYARERFQKEKVMIMGHSWGTALGSLYVLQHPEKVEAYIGLSQAINVREDKENAAKCALATEAIKGTKDEAELKELLEHWRSVSCYEELSMDKLSKMTTLSKKYIGCKGEVTGFDMFKIGLFSPDMNLEDAKWFLEVSNPEKYLSHNKEVIDYFIFQYDLRKESYHYEVPVYYLCGEGDYIIHQENARKYIEQIEAPYKEFTLVKNSGHDMFIDDTKVFGKVISQIVTGK